MPSTMTHTYFGIDVINKLPQKYQYIIKDNKNNFKLFCQGPDPFMFYHFFIGKKALEGKEKQSNMHSKKTKSFFINTIKYIYEKKYNKHPQIMSYLYGYICHYYLDMYTHPYIYYKTGIFKKNDKSTYQYNGQHQKMEYIIDLYMIEKREKTNPNTFKIHNNIFNITPFSKELTSLINTTLEKTYNYHNTAKLYYKSSKYMKTFFRLFNYDPHGIKHKIYKTIDKITKDSTINLEELSLHQEYKTKLPYYLNTEHKKWYYPWNNKEHFTTSFQDLYSIALKEATTTIIQITEMLENNTWNEELLNNIFKDLSYVTGKPCNQKLEMKYFEQ